MAAAAETLPTRVEAPASNASCAYVSSAADPAVLAELRELALKPGVRIDAANLAKDPRIIAAMAEMAGRNQARQKLDWAALCRYRAENARISSGSSRVVFLGDSITENWRYGDPLLFSQYGIDRGVSGQTTSQILLRIYADVVALHPTVVHIMAGTNDVLQDAAPITDDDILNNITAMIDIAQVNHIKVVLASVPPISVRSSQPNLKPQARITRLNARLRALAASRHLVFVDYHASLKDAEGGLRAELGNDGVHPNRAGYAVIRPLAERAIAQAMQ